jgi:hypothetical protein
MLSLAPVKEQDRWPRKKWIYAIGAIFAFQIIAILLLSERARPAARPPVFRTAIHLATDRWSEEQLSRLPLLSDPAAFALPNWRSFSRAGWLAFTPPEFQLTDWSEPPQWLTVDTNELGNTLHRFILSNTMPPLLIADHPLPRLRRDNVFVGNPPIASRSEFEVEGELASWILVDRFELPSWPHTELLTNTVVQSLVDQNGRSIATVILAGSGLAEADAFALRAVKVARFSPPGRPGSRQNPSSRVASGKVIFKWHTVPATNVMGATGAAAP